MTDSPPSNPDSPMEPTRSTTNVSGGIDINTQGNTEIGGDAVGRDKVVSTTTYHIEHATFEAPPFKSELPADETPAPGDPPYKGLQYFNEDDAKLFFGREDLTAQLVARLKDKSFLSVVGASGSGKSSLVRAGMIPLLRREHPHWQIHLITPTAHPIKELAASLTRDIESVTATATLIDDLTGDARSLDLATAKALVKAGQKERLLLVVDQFEELFTACKDESEQRAFINNLMYAVAPDTDGPLIILIALRADFYAYCAQFDSLRQALERHQAYIGPMTTAELCRAIEEPAHRSNWQFESGLVSLMLDDVGAEPGALPLLSHALLATWERRRGRTLTLQGYIEAGRANGAIAKTADAVLARLSPEQQLIARSIFLHLTELGEGVQDTRRRASFEELVSRPEDQSTVKVVLKTLSDARLITTGEDKAEDIVQVAHEALIREWPTLRKWLNEDRENLRLHRQLTQAALVWHSLNQDEGALYRGARLAQAVEWVESHTGEMLPLEREFFETSLASAERESAMHEAARQYELMLAKQRAEKALRTRNWVSSMLLIVLVIGGFYAIKNIPLPLYSSVIQETQTLTGLSPSGYIKIDSQIPNVVEVKVGVSPNDPTTPGNEVVVGYTRIGWANGPDEETARELALLEADNITVTLQPEYCDMKTLKIYINPGEAAPHPQDTVILYVSVPPSTQLGVKLLAGDIQLEGTKAYAEASTQKGNIEALGSTGSLKLTTHYGNIYVDNPGNQQEEQVVLDLEANVGNINIYATNVNAGVRTTKGNIRFVGSLAEGPDNFFATTESGEITLALPSNLPYSFTALGGKQVLNDFTDGTLVCGDTQDSMIDFHEQETLQSIGHTTIGRFITTTDYVTGTMIPANYFLFHTNRRAVSKFIPQSAADKQHGGILWLPECDKLDYKDDPTKPHFTAQAGKDGIIEIRAIRQH